MLNDVDEFGNQIVYVFDWPITVRGNVTVNPDGSNTIFINGKLNEWERMLVYEHEMKHITGGHFDLDFKFHDAEEI